ncbi:MAG: NAD(P)H-dependent glycerol-3-phosphate dehydrogenase [Sphingobacteriia bacterium]|nr:NAD(P)H-dependent glycerol-3-phosphate dehydrogenase [Sphingobacteriia bacterium]
MKIGVIGAGAWGTTLALHYQKIGSNVTIWSRDEELNETFRETGENIKYLPGFKFNKNGLRITNDPKEFSNNSYDAVLVTIPTQTIRKVLANFSLDNANIIICSKGIEETTLKLMHEVVEEVFPNSKTAMLSGPNLALGIAQSLPASTLIASKHSEIKKITDKSSSISFKFHFSEDIIGAQIFGACKNVLGIACGILRGLEVGENYFYYFLSQGTKEISELCITLGGSEETVFTPAGLGDIVLTCTGNKSRNNKLGYEIAINLDKNVEEVIKNTNLLSEGYTTAKSLYSLLKNKGIKSPILESVHNILYENESAVILKKLISLEKVS